MTKIKICGLTRFEDISAVNHCMPDYIGFVFAESRRRVTPQQAYLLKKELNPQMKAIGVFTNEKISSIVDLCEAGTIDMIQLHGDETESYIQELKGKTKHPIIKAVRVQCVEQIIMAQSLPCEFLLLDTWQNGQYGGSGKTFDHTLVPKLEKPFFIAGGLQIENIPKAILSCNPYGIDISSGVETDGLKDEKKIKEIVEVVRKIDKERIKKDER